MNPEKNCSILYIDTAGNGPYRREFFTEEERDAWVENSRVTIVEREHGDSDETTENGTHETLEEKFARLANNDTDGEPYNE